MQTSIGIVSFVLSCLVLPVSPQCWLALYRLVFSAASVMAMACVPQDVDSVTDPYGALLSQTAWMVTAGHMEAIPQDTESVTPE